MSEIRPCFENAITIAFYPRDCGVALSLQTHYTRFILLFYDLNAARRHSELWIQNVIARERT